MVGRQEHCCPLHFSDHGVEQMLAVDRALVGQCYLLARGGGPAVWPVIGTARNAIAKEAIAMNTLENRNMSLSL